MGSVAIQARRLGKRYRIGVRKEKYYSLRDTIGKAFRAPLDRFRRLGGESGDERERFWALRDLDLSVEHGEVLGIIGNNGAGKTTLLRLLSRITRPTTGIAEIRGRVGSLLEVGTGFHPELTGRENIYLNGAILGMKKREIDRQFDKIVSFSGLGLFLDTPVKRYSVGMVVRLGFSVAAHLEPEILLIDEVLAVGDAEFQRKCLERIEGISKGGRTVLFVSHNMGAIQNLCTRAILLEKGKLKLDGDPNLVIEKYMDSIEEAQSHSVSLRDHPNRQGTAKLLKDIKLFSEDKPSSNVRLGGSLKVRLTYSLGNGAFALSFGIGIDDSFARRIVTFTPNMDHPEVLARITGSGAIECLVPSLNLVPGRYHLSLLLAVSEELTDRIPHACSFQVVEVTTGEGPQLPRAAFKDLIFLPCDWRVDNRVNV